MASAESEAPSPGLPTVVDGSEAVAHVEVRISEAAFQVGFQSLSQFNRVFRKVAGESPTTYRERVMNPALVSA